MENPNLSKNTDEKVCNNKLNLHSIGLKLVKFVYTSLEITFI